VQIDILQLWAGILQNSEKGDSASRPEGVLDRDLTSHIIAMSSEEVISHCPSFDQSKFVMFFTCGVLNGITVSCSSIVGSVVTFTDI
jgi:hypothetical protein